ncbi:hypothetical protein SUGI_0374730 [Cryptomeria japonica]|nr:hypothetical protein SUGI_0374730 [Cryptomeria japonica]
MLQPIQGTVISLCTDTANVVNWPFQDFKHKFELRSNNSSILHFNPQPAEERTIHKKVVANHNQLDIQFCKKRNVNLGTRRLGSPQTNQIV